MANDQQLSVNDFVSYYGKLSGAFLSGVSQAFLISRFSGGGYVLQNRAFACHGKPHA